MEEHQEKDTGWGDAKSWLIVSGIGAGFLIWGLMLYFFIGDKGSPVWDYSIIEDIPGQATYSTNSPRQFPALIPHPVQQKPVEQHVMGPQNSPGQSQKGTKP